MLFKKKRKAEKDEFMVKITGIADKGDIEIEASNQEVLLSLKILVQNMAYRLGIPEYDIRTTVSTALYKNEIEFTEKIKK